MRINVVIVTHDCRAISFSADSQKEAVEEVIHQQKTRRESKNEFCAIFMTDEHGEIEQHEFLDFLWLNRQNV